MQDIKAEQAPDLKVSLRDRAIMLAISLIGAILILRPAIAFQNISRGNFFIDNGFTGRAISQYQRAIFLDPGFADVYGYLGFAYKKEKQMDKATEAYKKALEINPRDKQAYFELGNIYFSRDNMEKATDSFRKAAELDPFDLNARNMHANSLQKNGRIEEAISIWEGILKKNPEYEPAQTNLSKYK